MASVQLFAAAAASAVPTDSGSGVRTDSLRNANQLVFMAFNDSAGAGDSAIFRLWGYSSECNDTGTWYPLGTGTSATKGQLNAGTAVVVNGLASNSASHAEMILSLRDFERVAVSMATVTGTWTACLSTRDPGNRGQGER